MNEINTVNNNLPANIEDLSKFVLIGREKLVAVRAEIRAIDKVGLAEEVRRQKLEEAQDIAEAVLDAEVRLGELMAMVPKAKNQYKSAIDSGVHSTKANIIEGAGFTVKQAQRFETLAKHPEIVEQAKAQARENDDVVSRSFVLQRIKENKTPHVAYNSGNNEWYTPKEYIEAARRAMGSIDLDPASSEIANKVVKATKIYTVETDGLSHEWHGNVWLNPPYASDLIKLFTDKVANEAENISQAIILVNNATETKWFSELVKVSSAVVFPTGRVNFYKPDGSVGAPLQGQAVFYLGSRSTQFLDEFVPFGWGVKLHELPRQ